MRNFHTARLKTRVGVMRAGGVSMRKEKERGREKEVEAWRG